MTKNDIANQINHKTDIARTITTDWEMDFVVGQMYDNRGKAESWQDSKSARSSYEPEIKREYTYVLYCKNVDCHAVDYDNDKEVDILNAYESESEVLVPAETKMKITYVSEDADMGYYVVELEVVNEN
jgi:hypothetical protein